MPRLLTSDQATRVIEAMGRVYPDAKAELDYNTPFQLLIAVILSAQTTDIGVNRVTPALFEAYPTPEDMMLAPLEDLEDKLKTIGLYKNKAKFIRKCSRQLVEDFGGVVPNTHKELESLSGVGRKTANVVMSVAFEEPAIAVDTHVERVSKKFNIVPQGASVRKTEDILMEKLPRDLWSTAHHILIFFGRYQCLARNHDHNECIRLVQENLQGEEISFNNGLDPIIDEYISTFSADIEDKLLEIHTLIMKEIPDATITFAYKMPTYKLSKNVIHFAAFSKHIGLYPGPKAIESAKEKGMLEGYKTSKGTIQIPLGEEIPRELIQFLVQFNKANQ